MKLIVEPELSLEDISIYKSIPVLEDMTPYLTGIEYALEQFSTLSKIAIKLNDLGSQVLSNNTQKLVKISLENCLVSLPIDSSLISLESHTEPLQANIALETIMDKLRDIWKAIVDTFKWVYEKVISLFKPKKVKSKLVVIKVEKVNKELADILKNSKHNVKFEVSETSIGVNSYKQLLNIPNKKVLTEQDIIDKLNTAIKHIDTYRQFINEQTTYFSFLSHEVDQYCTEELLGKGNYTHKKFSTEALNDESVSDFIIRQNQYLETNIMSFFRNKFEPAVRIEQHELEGLFRQNGNAVKITDVNIEDSYQLSNLPFETKVLFPKLRENSNILLNGKFIFSNNKNEDLADVKYLGYEGLSKFNEILPKLIKLNSEFQTESESKAQAIGNSIRKINLSIDDVFRKDGKIIIDNKSIQDIVSVVQQAIKLFHLNERMCNLSSNTCEVFTQLAIDHKKYYGED